MFIDGNFRVVCMGGDDEKGLEETTLETIRLCPDYARIVGREFCEALGISISEAKEKTANYMAACIYDPEVQRAIGVVKENGGKNIFVTVSSRLESRVRNLAVNFAKGIPLPEHPNATVKFMTQAEMDERKKRMGKALWED